VTDERADLDQLLQSPGWLRFLEYARQSWKDGLPSRITGAAELGATDAEKGAAMLKVLYTAQEINALLSWPKERLARLNMPETQTTLSRGGYDPTPAR
jgi:hypothetical protein